MRSVLVVVLAIIVLVSAEALSPRFVCLLNNYSSIAGQQFTTLFRELCNQANPGKPKRLLLIQDPSSQGDDDDDDRLRKDLALDTCRVLTLDDPERVRTGVARFDPNILWVRGSNAHLLRHWMRATDFDGVVNDGCGPANADDAWLYVGESGGAVCAGASVRACRDDPRAAPEPQFRGLELLGSRRSFVCCDEQEWVESAETRLGHKVFGIERQKAFIWTQRGNHAQSFFLERGGSLESLSFPDPVPPLQVLNQDGRTCTGEPSVDPSRSMQSDSDVGWMD